MSKVRDYFQIIRYLSAKRLLNLVALKSSYIFSRLLKQSLHLGSPFSLSVEPTTACNLGCPECPSGLKQFTRPTGKLALDLHQKLLDEVAPFVFYINYYFQGEPFLHPQFLDLIRQAKEKRIYTATSTNAHFIDAKKAEEIVQSGLDRLIISIDGLTQTTYENYRIHGQLSKVIEGTKHLLAAKERLASATPHVIFQFLVVQQNEHEIPALFSLAKELGIKDVRLKSAQLYDYKNGHHLMPKNEQYSRYKQLKDGTYRLKYEVGNHCWRMWSSAVLTWDGGVVPCCFDKDAKYQLGQFSNSSFQDIWKSKDYQQFRLNVLTHRNQIDICQNCSEGAKVWL